MYNDEGASETFCLSECCAPGCIICFGGEEKTGLPNVTSSVETLLCVALLVATGLSIFFMKAGRWKQLAVREHWVWLFWDVFFPVNDFKSSDYIQNTSDCDRNVSWVTVKLSLDMPNGLGDWKSVQNKHDLSRWTTDWEHFYTSFVCFSLKPNPNEIQLFSSPAGLISHILLLFTCKVILSKCTCLLPSPGNICAHSRLWFQVFQMRLLSFTLSHIQYVSLCWQDHRSDCHLSWYSQATWK